MNKTTLSDAIRRIMGGEDVRVVLTEHANYVRQLSNTAWDTASEASVDYRDNGLEEARLRGKAHAFCEAMGDQSALFPDLDSWEWHEAEGDLDPTKVRNTFGCICVPKPEPDQPHSPACVWQRRYGAA